MKCSAQQKVQRMQPDLAEAQRCAAEEQEAILRRLEEALLAAPPVEGL